MSRIQLTDTIQNVIVKMSDGNPGAITAMMELLSKANQIDKSESFPVSYILLLDTYGIYGTDIYVMYNDICGRNLAKFMATIRATQLGLFDSKLLVDACSRQDYSGRELVPAEELLEKIKQQIPEFNCQA